MTNLQYQRLAFVGIILLFPLFLLQSNTLLDGAREALMLALNTVLPSLFPFLVLSGILSAAAHGLSLPGARLFSRLFRLPEAALLPFLLGALCGFPVGVSSVCDLWHAGELTKEEAMRAAALSANTGPAFAVAGVGGAMFGDPMLGLTLYWLQILLAILLGIIAARHYPIPAHRPAHRRAPKPIEFSAILVSASHSAIAILGAVLFFGAIASLPARFLPAPIATAFCAFLEVSNGASAAAHLSPNIGIPLAAFSLSFSGLSVLSQSAALLGPAGIPMRPLFWRKLCQGILAAIIIPFLV